MTAPRPGPTLVFFCLLTFSLILAGCGGLSPSAISPSATAPSAAAPTAAAVSPSPADQTTIGAQVPPDDPSLPHIDRAGHVPGDVVLALINADQRHDWRAAYALYAHPWATFKIASAEWAAANERYQDFVICETRVLGQGKGKGNAVVRVSYRCETSPSPGQRYTVVVKPPGEWWSVEKVDGLWKVSWLTRQ